MRKIPILICLVVVLLLSTTIWLFAAEQVRLICRTPDCKFFQETLWGPTMMTDVVTGYCTNCKKVVEIRWKDRQMLLDGTRVENPPPKPLGTVWDAEQGVSMAIYACPTCKGPFLPFSSDRKKVRFCPECKNPSLSIEDFGVIKD